MADQLKRIADALDGGDPNVGKPTEKGNLRRIADYLDGGDPDIGKPSEEGSLKRIADYIVENGIGGGGSGDFTIAHVTFVNTVEGSVRLYLPNIVTVLDAQETEQTVIGGSYIVGEFETKTVDVVLYQNACDCGIEGYSDYLIEVMSGDAEITDGYGYTAIVKGDCTLKIKSE